MAFDLVIRNGIIVDGTGDEPFESDVGIVGGRIAQIGHLAQHGRDEIDAKGLLVTPGFVDIHTHYDGQAIWSPRLAPSSSHGVTTVVTGNCGVGFAPCRRDDHSMLIEVMEGVEDIPGVVMAEGLDWDWETFPQYLDALDRRPHDIDIAAQLPHSALRVYVMGERGAMHEAATVEDLARMRCIAGEAIDAGALGFATSRLPIHRTRHGAPIPSFDAAESELLAIAEGLKERGRGVLQFVLSFPDLAGEIALLGRVARASGRPASFSLAQDNANPDSWREALSLVSDVNRSGCELRAQIFPRPIGLLVGHSLSVNPFCLCPSYQKIAQLPLSQRLVELRNPDLRHRLLTEPQVNPVAPLAVLGRKFDRMFPMSDPLNYEPPLATSIASQAAQRGILPEELAYDLLLENDGNAMLYVAIANYAGGNLDAQLEMMLHEHTVLGLGDGGAHYGMISDASYPTFLLSYWTRDRVGKKLSLPEAVRALSRETACAVRLNDRGIVAPGYRADINVIDYDRLQVGRPRVIDDLPAGGRRLMQDAEGFVTTIVGGVRIANEGKPLNVFPGRLVRGQQGTPQTGI